MAQLVLVVLTILSCVLFEFSRLKDTIKILVSSYKKQFEVLSDKELADEIKQKILLQNVVNQLGLLLKLILGIVLFIAPFLSLYILQQYNADLSPNILITWWGLSIPIVTVILYIIFKRVYGRLFSNR